MGTTWTKTKTLEEAFCHENTAKRSVILSIHAFLLHKRPETKLNRSAYGALVSLQGQYHLPVDIINEDVLNHMQIPISSSNPAS